MNALETRRRIENGLKCLSDIQSYWKAFEKPVSILIVDDDALFCEVLEARIKATIARECVITKADCGHDALENLRRSKVDLLFVDLRMPKHKGDGLEVLRNVNHYADMIVMVVTGIADDSEEVSEARRLGFDTIIRKTELADDLQLIFGGKGMKL